MAKKLADFLTTGGAAALLDVSTSTIRRLIDRGDLPAVEAGGRWLVRPEDVNALEDHEFDEDEDEDDDHDDDGEDDDE